jgi:RPA family protein
MEKKAPLEPTIDSRPYRRVHIADLLVDSKSDSTISERGQPVLVKIFGTVVDKGLFRSKGKVDYSVILVDDGSGLAIHVKTWGDDTKMLENVGVGDLIDVVGKTRWNKDAAYITPMIIHKVNDPNWETVHELEIIRDQLKKDNTKPSSPVQQEQRLVKIESKLIEIIESVDNGTGVQYGELVDRIEHSTEDEVKKALNELLSKGEIYESRPGRYMK